MRNSSGTPLGGQTYTPTKIGTLGFNTGREWARDGSWEVTRTDVGGAYRRDAGDSVWHQILTFISNAGAAAVNAGGGWGVDEIRIAPSDSNIAWMFWVGRAWRSADKGKTWADTNINSTTGLQFDANVKLRGNIQDKSAIDPSNPEVVYFGSPNNGLWQRLSGTWSRITSVPISPDTTEGDRVITIAVDPSSSLVGSGATSRRSVVYCTVSASGVYKSTDGGTTFSLLSSYPNSGGNKRYFHIYVGPTGTVWLADNAGANENFWKSTNGGTGWTAVTHGLPGPVTCIQIDPKSASRLVCTMSLGWVSHSEDTGATWAGYNLASQKAVATNVPLAIAPYENAFNGVGGLFGNGVMSKAEPHPTLNKVSMAMGYGTFYANAPAYPTPAVDAFLLIEDTMGMEELVGYDGCIVPGGKTFTISLDQAVIPLNAAGYATINFPAGLLNAGQSVDYSIDNSHQYIAARVAPGGVDSSGYSTDGGNTWQAYPSTIAANGGFTAVSNHDQVVCVPGWSYWPRYLRTSDNTWQKCTFSGFTTTTDGTTNGWDWNGGYARKCIVAPKNQPGVFLIYNDGSSDSSKQGIWKSTDGGQNYTKLSGGPTGIIPGLDTGFTLRLECALNGDLYMSLGTVGNPYVENTNQNAWRSLDGGVTWTTLPNVTETLYMSTGAPAPGSSTPYALYMYGFYNHARGLYRSLDKGATFVLLTQQGWFDDLRSITADPDIFGRVLIGYSGTGFFISDYSYKLLVKGS